MIKRNEQLAGMRAERFKDGAGYLLGTHILQADEMCGKGRVFMHGRLEKGCEVGWHVHTGDCEVYYFLTGEGEYNDNGETVTVRAGDMSFTGDGEGHSLKNLRDEPLEFIALVLYT